MTREGSAQFARLGVYVSLAGLAVAAGWVAVRASDAAPVIGCKVKRGSLVKVEEILDGGALKLSDGRRVLLSGIETPRAKSKTGQAPFSSEARAGLEAVLGGRLVALGEEGAPSKGGWIRAQVFAGGSEWVQGALVVGGFARVRTFPDRRECAQELLKHESAARAANRGIWALPAYAIRTPSTTRPSKGGYQLVEGRVEKTANIGGRVFLNFGPDYKTDFSVHVKPDSVRLFAQAGVDLDALEGKRVRVRGYVRDRNGPQIDASVPEQIELLP